DFTKLSAGRLVLGQQPENVQQLVDDALAIIEPLAKAKQLRIERELSAGALSVQCDRERIQQVLANILANAVKVTNSGGSVRLLAEREGSCVRFAIADTGPGIAEEELAHVFERYWQARRTASRGTGLGLAIARGIVNAHGGRIWAESRLGEGSTFLFTLPI